jgi:hypothetical protein
MALGISLCCLGFILAAAPEKASANYWNCRSCEPHPTIPDIYLTCRWFAPEGHCDTEPHMYEDCLQSLSCDF